MPKAAKLNKSSAESCESIIDSDNSTDFVVEKILDHRTYRGVPQYLVKWKNFEEEDNTWELATDLAYVVQDWNSLLNSYKREQSELSGKELNIIYETKAKQLKIDPGIVLDSPFNRDFKAQEILEGFNNNGEVSFLIKFWHLKKPEIVPSSIAYVEIPQMVFRFYEKHSNFPSFRKALDDHPPTK